MGRSRGGRFQLPYLNTHKEASHREAHQILLKIVMTIEEPDEVLFLHGIKACGYEDINDKLRQHIYANIKKEDIAVHIVKNSLSVRCLGQCGLNAYLRTSE